MDKTSSGIPTPFTINPRKKFTWILSERFLRTCCSLNRHWFTLLRKKRSTPLGICDRLTGVVHLINDIPAKSYQRGWRCESSDAAPLVATLKRPYAKIHSIGHTIYSLPHLKEHKHIQYRITIPVDTFLSNRTCSGAEYLRSTTRPCALSIRHWC